MLAAGQGRCAVKNNLDEKGRGKTGGWRRVVGLLQASTARQRAGELGTHKSNGFYMLGMIQVGYDTGHLA